MILFRGIYIFIVSAVALVPMTVTGQTPGLQSSADAVDVRIHPSHDGIEPGGTIRFAVALNILDDWHVNANRPTLDYLIGTDLALERHPDFILSDIRYPPSRRFRFAFADQELDVYDGEAPIFLEFRASENAAPGPRSLAGELTVQACDDEVCLAPSRIPVEIPVQLVASGAPVAQINQQAFVSYGRSVAPGGVGTNEIAALFDTRGWFFAFAAIFMIGLALNLTPCVYPMLSVTVSLFGAQTDPNTWRVFSRAGVYVLGIATMYSALGVLAAMTGGLFGAWLQSPWVLAGIAVLLFALAMSMFGWYELQLPYWLTSRIGGGGTTGVAGLYLSGLVVGIFAAPCIGPPIIALLAFVGAQGDPFFGFWSFFVLSVGLGLPYLILGTFSGLMTRLPKSGLWMVWIKKVFGVVLIGAGLFYAGLALFPQVVAYVVPVTLLAGGIYLGFVERSGWDRRRFRAVKMAVGSAAVLFSLVAFANLQKPGMEWESYSADRLAAAAADGRPVVMDFYADWCIPCLELERRTFTDADVIEVTDHFVRLKVDLTHFSSPEAEQLRQRYDIAGVPTIVFLSPSGEEVSDARVVGFVPPREFIKRVRKVEMDEG